MDAHSTSTTLEAIRALNPAYVIKRQEKDFVLYAGLLDYATQHGLTMIHTTIVQAPHDSNNQMAIVHAAIDFADGRHFEGIGDATPQNVTRAIAMHAVRMAETRAKARGLRDALNVGGAAFEELGRESDESDDADLHEPRIRSHAQLQREVAQMTSPSSAQPRRDVEHVASTQPPQHVAPLLPNRTSDSFAQAPSTPIVPGPRAALLATLKRGLDALGYPIDEDAIAALSDTQLRVKIAALRDDFYRKHPELDTREKPAPEPPVQATPRQAKAIARAGDEFRRAAGEITGYREDDVTF